MYLLAQSPQPPPPQSPLRQNNRQTTNNHILKQPAVSLLKPRKHTQTPQDLLISPVLPHRKHLARITRRNELQVPVRGPVIPLLLPFILDEG